MTIPIIYVFSSTKGEYVNGEQRDTELYTVAVTADGTELFRTHGTLDPMRLDVRVEDHAALHSALRTYAPNGYEVQWHAPPETADEAAPTPEKQGSETQPTAPVEGSDLVSEAAVQPAEVPAASGEPAVEAEPAAADAEPVKHSAVSDIIHNIETELKTLTEGL